MWPAQSFWPLAVRGVEWHGFLLEKRAQGGTLQGIPALRAFLLCACPSARGT